MRTTLLPYLLPILTYKHKYKNNGLNIQKHYVYAHKPLST